MTTADRLFDDAELAALYDAMCPRASRADFDFYLPLVMKADAVLDVGCGTGAMLHEARAAGHSGRLVGLDPAAGMLAQAARRSDIEWVQGDLTMLDEAGAFDLIVMTGHAFQTWLSDDQITAGLAAMRAAIAPEGRIAFETRNPGARAWETWLAGEVSRFVDDRGVAVEMRREIIVPFDGRCVTFRHRFDSTRWNSAGARCAS